MCELLALSFNKPIRPHFSLRVFNRRGTYNPDGWGLGYYPDQASQVVKEPVKAGDSLMADFIKNQVRSKLIISHIRYSSRGGKMFKNTHPFQREMGGKDYVFAHNGTLKNASKLSTGRFLPLGETDSEKAFCHLLHRLEQLRIDSWSQENVNSLQKILKQINTLGTFNCLFSDGEYLFVYFDAAAYNGLCYVIRTFPYNEVILEDEDFAIDLQEEKDAQQKGLIFATKKLSNEPWKKLLPGELLICKQGQILASSEKTEWATRINVLRLIRTNSSRLSLKTIFLEVNKPKKEIKLAVENLLQICFIKQDRRDTVPWNSENATYYTVRDKREEIDALI